MFLMIVVGLLFAWEFLFCSEESPAILRLLFIWFPLAFCVVLFPLQILAFIGNILILFVMLVASVFLINGIFELCGYVGPFDPNRNYWFRKLSDYGSIKEKQKKYQEEQDNIMRERAERSLARKNKRLAKKALTDAADKLKEELKAVSIKDVEAGN